MIARSAHAGNEAQTARTRQNPQNTRNCYKNRGRLRNSDAAPFCGYDWGSLPNRRGGPSFIIVDRSSAGVHTRNKAQRARPLSNSSYFRVTYWAQLSLGRFLFFSGHPSLGGDRGRVRTIISPRRLWVLGRFRPGSGGENLLIIFMLASSAAGYLVWERRCEHDASLLPSTCTVHWYPMLCN